MLVEITLKSGDDNAIPEMATGYVETDDIQALVKAVDGEFIDGEIVCEWGNGEGNNVYTVDIIEADEGAVVFSTESPTEDGGKIETYVTIYIAPDDNTETIQFQANLDGFTPDGLSSAADGWGEIHKSFTQAVEECQDMLVDWLNAEA